MAASSTASATRLDTKVVLEVVRSLKDYTKKKAKETSGGKKNLFDSDDSGAVSSPIFAQVQLVKDVARKVARPVRVKIPHSLYFQDEFDHSVCLFCRSADKEELETFFGNNKSIKISKIVSLDEVKKVYKRFEDKKALLKEHSHFVCDARIMSHLYNLLGKVFAVNNHFPVPIDFDKIDSKLVGAVQKVIHDSTFMFIKGQTITIRLGYTFMPDKDVTNNITSGLEFAVPKLKDEWKSVHSIWLKTANSTAMPIYAKTESKQLNYIKQQIEEAEKKNKPSKVDNSSNSSVSSSAKKGKTAAVAAVQAVATPSAKAVQAVATSSAKAVQAVATPSAKAVQAVATPSAKAAAAPAATPSASTRSASSRAKTPIAEAAKSTSKIISKSSAPASTVKDTPAKSLTASTASSAKKAVSKPKTPK